MNKTINLNQLLATMSKFDDVKYKNLNELIEIQNEVFKKFFKTVRIQKDEVYLIFENRQDATSFYLDCNYGNQTLKGVGVYYDLTDEKKLILKPIFDVISLIDSRKPGLCQISENLSINFKLEYKQSFSNSSLELYIQQGFIVEPECIIRVSDTLPYLGLGQMITLIRNEVDYRRLNTRIEIMESENMYESNRISNKYAIYS